MHRETTTLQLLDDIIYMGELTLTLPLSLHKMKSVCLYSLHDTWETCRTSITMLKYDIRCFQFFAVEKTRDTTFSRDYQHTCTQVTMNLKP